MRIADLYKLLCSIYTPKNTPDIEDYLITHGNFRETAMVGNSMPNREALYIRESGDGIEIGLFISPAIITLIKSGNVLEHPDELSCAIEGVSHFLYVADRAAKGRKVSRLELELQGEVDKFLIIHLIASWERCFVDWNFFNRQFETHSFDPSLGSEDAERYAAASHFAAKYCAHLRSTCFNPLKISALTHKARDFFERNFEEKIERLIP